MASVWRGVASSAGRGYYVVEAGLNCRVGVACACRRRGSFGWEGFPRVEAGLDAEKAWPAFEGGVASSDGRGFHVWRRGYKHFCAISHLGYKPFCAMSHFTP